MIGKGKAFACLCVLGGETPDAPVIKAGPHVVRFGELVGKVDRVIDEAAVHVADVEGSVRSVAQVDRAAPFVGGDEEVASLSDALSFEAGTLLHESISGDELGCGVADEEVAAKSGDPVAAVDCEPAGRSVRAGVGHRSGVAEGVGENTGGGWLDVFVGCGEPGGWIAVGEGAWEYLEDGRVPVAAEEDAAEDLEDRTEDSESFVDDYLTEYLDQDDDEKGVDVRWGSGGPTGGNYMTNRTKAKVTRGRYFTPDTLDSKANYEMGFSESPN